MRGVSISVRGRLQKKVFRSPPAAIPMRAKDQFVIIDESAVLLDSLVLREPQTGAQHCGYIIIDMSTFDDSTWSLEEEAEPVETMDTLSWVFSTAAHAFNRLLGLLFGGQSSIDGNVFPI